MSATNHGPTAIISLRIVSALLHLSVICAAAWAFSAQDKVYTDGVGGTYDGALMGVNICAFIWAAFIAGYRVPLGKSMRPAVYIFFDFVFLAALAISTGFMFDWLYQDNGMISSYSCLRGDGCDGDILPKVAFAAAIMTSTNCGFYLLFLVWASWVCYGWRKEKSPETETA